MKYLKSTDFKPAPWCINGHGHTILCSLLFTSPFVEYERETIDTPDGDFIELDILDKNPDGPVVVLFHGLEGHSRRYYVTRLAKVLIQNGCNVVAVNLRSCGSKMNLSRRFYHSGETEDPNLVFEWVKSRYPNAPLLTAGFSLGASIILNYLKKYGKDHPVESAVAISTPFELRKGSLNLEKGINRIYSIRFLKTLVDKLNQKRKKFPDLPEFTGSTLYDFDDQITAPVHGFADADDYYRSCSSGFFMDQIQTSCLIIHSKDDPMCPFKWTPTGVITGNPNLTSCFTDKGGHVGFWSLPPGWLNNTVAYYFEEEMKKIKNRLHSLSG